MNTALVILAIAQFCTAAKYSTVGCQERVISCYNLVNTDIADKDKDKNLAVCIRKESLGLLK